MSALQQGYRLPTFRTFAQADNFAAGYCVSRVVARLPRGAKRPFVICHPGTAARRGWKVVAS